MRYLINYADKTYKKAQKLCSYSAIKNAKFDMVIEFGPEDIDDSFRECNKKILSYKRGNGLWLWKPYIILKALRSLKDGDILFYADSGVLFIRNFKKIFEKIQENEIWVTELPLLEYQFTKHSVLTSLDAAEIEETNQISASFIGIKKNEKTVHFVEKWLNLCTDETLLSPDILQENERVDFIEHREDQSILSVLCKKNDVKACSDISEYGIYPELYWIKKEIVIKPGENVDFQIPYIIHYRRWKTLGRTIVKDTILLCMPKGLGKKLILKRKMMYWR